MHLKAVVALTVLVLVLAGFPPSPRAEPYAAEGGRLELGIEPDVLARLGVTAELPRTATGWNFSAGVGGTLDFVLQDGDAVRLTGGSLTFVDGPRLTWDGGAVDLSHFRLEPMQSEPNALAVVDESGRAWFTLHMGHFDFRPEAARLDGYVMDLRLADGFAQRLGFPRLGGLWLGSAELKVRLAGLPSSKGTMVCTDPAWPNQPGNRADLEMINIGRVDELAISAAREAGRVIITPSARFRNAGTADLPWFWVFSNPDDDGDFCIDDGTGRCQPYGNDQQGLLIWNLYRLSFGRLEQIGRSGVKHAFNSINEACSCNFGRIVWAGCEDLYSTSTNVNQIFLGHRDRVEANPVVFNRCGSVFDEDCDDVCDVPAPGSNLWKCEANPAEDVFDRRLSVPEEALSQPFARYFIEAWYLVRDDVDIFNSMGYREISPTFIETAPGEGVWNFDFIGEFQPGPAALGLAAEAGLTIDLHETGNGTIALATGTDVDLAGRRYKVVIINFDFDPQIEQLVIPTHRDAEVSSVFFSDGDDRSDNDWNFDMDPERLVFSARPGHSLDWGTMVVFEFDSRQGPADGLGTLGITMPVTTANMLVHLPRPAPVADFIHGSGFE